jgi:predicted dinucleotide-binding enzyme
MKETIAVVGATGTVGSGIARTLAKAGYRVLLADCVQDDPTQLMGKLPEVLTRIVFTVPHADVFFNLSTKDACWEADIIVFAVPHEAQAPVAAEIRRVVTKKIIVTIAPATSAAEGLSRLLPYSKIVAVFAAIPDADINELLANGRTIDVFIAGNDQEAVATIANLVRETGFNPVLAGTLERTRELGNNLLPIPTSATRIDNE